MDLLFAISILEVHLNLPRQASPLAFARIKKASFPFSILLGLKPEDWEVASQILGSRFIETEVSAYFSLASNQTTDAALSLRSMTIMTYALCGFVHISSMGIFVGGLAPLVPSRTSEISLVGLQALWTSFLATLLTGCIAGCLVI